MTTFRRPVLWMADPESLALLADDLDRTLPFLPDCCAADRTARLRALAREFHEMARAHYQEDEDDD
jgi:hypothetical protein